MLIPFKTMGLSCKLYSKMTLNSNAKKPLQQCNGFFVFWRKLARGKGKVASLEGRDASCRRRFNAEKRVIRYKLLEVRLKIPKLAS